MVKLDANGYPEAHLGGFVSLDPKRKRRKFGVFEFDQSTICLECRPEMEYHQNTTLTANRPKETFGMEIGYARVSTDDQRLDLQIAALEKAGIPEDRIYKEHVSGVSTKRPQLTECMKAMREGDLLVVWRLDRLGRSLPDLIKILSDLQARGIGFRSLNESIDTTTAVGRMVFHMMGAIAQFERDIISERTKAGLTAARARGHRGGRKSKVTPAMLRAAKAMLLDPLITAQEAADALKIGRASLYRALAKDREAGDLKAMRKAARKARGAAKRTVLA